MVCFVSFDVSIRRSAGVEVCEMMKKGDKVEENYNEIMMNNVIQGLKEGFFYHKGYKGYHKVAQRSIELRVLYYFQMFYNKFFFVILSAVLCVTSWFN